MFTVNGTKKELPGVFSVKEYLEQNGYVISQIAVELNEEILPKTEYVSTVLKDGDVMEIVSFMGGGSC
ncbi:sulfur carrier protein ThiS [Ruminococcus sp. AF37-6AT]|uniref:sulfur carrier protein ThiS n=1 Tax=unclassified Blautia TaxID=2648079 RepID=UPI000E54D4A7|nr:sulfur carrier protein ThiS [uncultured Blautia sp.]MBS6712410.1 sulfur carrier protein ThiS [Ruminococcus sp.]RGY90826.1 sulfur carrier protein ThiS [Ruminococcus sp. AM58-7XD]RHD91851.1 sulfur carrier protein ThiS [Ruminococcus sp. AM30-15AC]RHG57463.1 sulfur carrier protein ThiS [Ruminococcus sp. AM22-13]RHJ99432.1 sulfur carrier protein ThiS [Ruminococcus sp. AM07-21]RHL44425.1 sulfur carrier protein ThiS [Ruminococcus sp. AF37-6AT]RHO85877.1 sulfur carrier protein ThiS [Ruminococcus 